MEKELCKDCIYKREMKYKSLVDNNIKIRFYCLKGFDIDDNRYKIIECREYKSKVNWNKINNRIIESEKDRERIKKRRARGK